jgi:predicted ribosomally synthesized peptide with SipW-like signal peptide
MKPSLFIGLLLFTLFAILMAALTYFSDSSTSEQQLNSLYGAVLSGLIGASLIAYSTKHQTNVF